MLYLLALLLPPLAVLFCGKPFQAILNIGLSLLFYFPGMLHALLVVASYQADNRQAQVLDGQRQMVASQQRMTDAIYRAQAAQAEVQAATAEAEAAQAEAQAEAQRQRIRQLRGADEAATLPWELRGPGQRRP